MRITNLLKTKLAGLLVVALCASLVVPALGGYQQVDPTTSQYGGQLSQVNTGGKSGGGLRWAVSCEHHEFRCSGGFALAVPASVVTWVRCRSPALT